MRLETLEGISAFHRSEHAAARALLCGAQAKWQRLQVSDVSLALLASMGFSALQVLPPSPASPPSNSRAMLIICTAELQSALHRLCTGLTWQKLHEQRVDSMGHPSFQVSGVVCSMKFCCGGEQGKRALQFCGGDVDRAADFAMQQQQKEQVCP